MSASTFIMTMCLALAMAATATSAPALGRPVASITTSTSGMEQSASMPWIAASSPLRMAALASDTVATTRTL